MAADYKDCKAESREVNCSAWQILTAPTATGDLSCRDDPQLSVAAASPVFLRAADNKP